MIPLLKTPLLKKFFKFLRVANAVKTTNSNSFGKNPLIRPPITAMGRRTELVRDGFHKINR